MTLARLTCLAAKICGTEKSVGGVSDPEAALRSHNRLWLLPASASETPPTNHCWGEAVNQSAEKPSRRCCFFSEFRCFDWIRRSTDPRDGRVLIRRRGGWATDSSIARRRS